MNFVAQVKGRLMSGNAPEVRADDQQVRSGPAYPITAREIAGVQYQIVLRFENLFREPGGEPGRRRGGGWLLFLALQGIRRSRCLTIHISRAGISR